MTGKLEWYRSSYELLRFRQLDAAGIDWTTSHGILVPYVAADGSLRNYVMDLVATNPVTQETWYEEVKPRKLLSLDVNRRKLAAARALGYDLRVITEAELGIE